jgi:uncharacterized protein
MNIGVISDTHGLLRPEAIAELAGVDHILHAGDVYDPGILDRLREIAPLTAIRGNVDTATVFDDLHPTEAVELGGCLFYLVHSIDDLDLHAAAAGIGAVISGHSHKPSIDWRDGVLYLNPGSAGPRRFSLPITLARITLIDGKPHPQIITLIPQK